MAKVEILESSFVVPSAETPKHNIWLSNLDLLLSPRYTTLVSLYRRPDAVASAPDFFSLPRLKAALADATVPFYPFAGRLALDPSGRLELRCTAEGVLLVVARSPSTLDAFGDLSQPSLDMARLLLPNFEHSEPPPPVVPIMFQLTFFACGAVCLGTAIHHTTTDGADTFRFLNTWADLSRGVRRPITLSLDRTVLRARSPPTVQFDHVEYRCVPRNQRPSSSSSSSASAAAAPPPATATLILSRDQLATLTDRCGGGVRGRSTFQVVMAHVWRCVCKVRELKEEDETRLYTFASVRDRVRPPLPRDYFGNALVRTSAAASVGEILSSPLRYAADKIHGATARLKDEYVRSIIDHLELLEDIRGLHVESRTRSQTELWGVSLLQLPIYGTDFGWGKPAFFGRAHLNVKGLVYVAPSAGEEGEVSVAVALEPENMPRFKKAFYEDLEGSGAANSPHPRL